MDSKSINILDLYVKFISDLSDLYEVILIYEINESEVDKKNHLLFCTMAQIYDCESEICFFSVDDLIFVNNQRVPCGQNNASKLFDLLHQKKIKYVKFLDPITKDEVIDFFDILMHKEGNYDSRISSDFFLESNHIQRNIECYQELDSSLINGCKSNRLLQYQDFANNFQRFQDVYEKIIADRLIDGLELKSLIEDLLPQIISSHYDVLSFGLFSFYEPDSIEHFFNVMILTVLLAQKLDIPKELLIEIGIAVCFYDIGRIVVSKQTNNLNKPKQNDYFDDSYSIAGTKFLLFNKLRYNMAIISSFEYQLNKQKKNVGKNVNESLSVLSKMIKITDQYDILRSSKLFIGEITPLDLYQIMSTFRDDLFEPVLFDLFFQMVGIYPIGIQMLLDDGKRVKVIENNPDDIFNPLIQELNNQKATDKNYQNLMREENSGYYLGEHKIIKTYAPITY